MYPHVGRGAVPGGRRPARLRPRRRLRLAYGGTAMNIDDPATFRDQLGWALADGPAWVDQILFAPDRARPMLAVAAPDRTLFWFTYDIDTGNAWATAIRPPGEPARELTGAGCGRNGFRLAAPQTWMVYELLALAHHPMAVVRCTAADLPSPADPPRVRGMDG